MPAFSLLRLALLCSAASLAPSLWAGPASTPAPAPASNTPLRDTRWTLQTIEGEPVVAHRLRDRIRLSLRAASQHLTGFAGCNTLGGRYIQRGTSLALKPLATTRTACEAEAMQQEARFLQTLASVNAYRVEGHQLSLMRGDVVVLTFLAPAAR